MLQEVGWLTEYQYTFVVKHENSLNMKQHVKRVGNDYPIKIMATGRLFLVSFSTNSFEP